jgi:hypothetical protein
VTNAEEPGTARRKHKLDPNSTTKQHICSFADFQYGSYKHYSQATKPEK